MNQLAASGVKRLEVGDFVALTINREDHPAVDLEFGGTVSPVADVEGYVPSVGLGAERDHRSTLVHTVEPKHLGGEVAAVERSLDGFSCFRRELLQAINDEKLVAVFVLEDQMPVRVAVRKQPLDSGELIGLTVTIGEVNHAALFVVARPYPFGAEPVGFKTFDD